MADEFDLVATGRPYTDIIVNTTDELIRSFGLRKGVITEISPKTMMELRGEFNGYTIYPGGSPPNTVAGFAALGGKAAFLGKVCDDAGGRCFRNAFRHGCVVFPNQDYPAQPGAISATCMVLVTPDDVGTVVNCPGVSDELTEADVFPDIIAASRILFLQAHYLFCEKTRGFVFPAMEVAAGARRKLALSLHDHRFTREQADSFMKTCARRADILIGNRQEFEPLFGTDIEPLQDSSTLLVMTDGEAGSFISGHGEYHHIAPYLIGSKPNTVGAGDQYAAGFFFGYLAGLPLAECGEFGSETASEILMIPGARPTGSWTHIRDRYLAGRIDEPRAEYRGAAR
jgi:sugar/nucleoside kinase (ribokinase family)